MTPDPKPAIDAAARRADPFDPPRRPGSLGRIAHFEVEAFLGRGAFGTVVRAFDEKLQRPVAIKLLSSNFGPETSAYQRFLREARAAATIRHDNVVQIYAVEEVPCPYIVMECVAGETLQDRLDRVGKFDVVEAVTVCAQAARGLAAAHERGLVHRDIKPCNILVEMIAGELRVKIADFGLALSKQDARLTTSGMVAGTPMYMAPEQASSLTLDGRADLFSLGSVLYALLTGVAPFGDSNPSLVLGRIVGHEPKPLRERAPHVPLAVCRVVAKLHAKNPEHRYRTGKEVADALTKALTEPDPPPAALPSRRSFASRPRRLALALGVVAVMAAGTYLAMTNLGGPGTGAQSSAAPAPKLEPPKPEPPKSAPKPAYAWTKPIPVPGIRTPSREYAPTLTSDELVIVFAGPDGLYTARRPTRTVPFEPSTKLKLELDSAIVPDQPTITGNGLRLVFKAKSQKEISFWEAVRENRDAPFGTPKPLTFLLASDELPYLSADGLCLFVHRKHRQAMYPWIFERKTVLSDFDSGKPVPIQVPSDQHGAVCWLSPDRKQLATTKYALEQNSSRLLDWDASRGEGQEFYGHPKPLKAGPDLGQPWFTPEGSRMYYHSRDPNSGGSGEFKIYYTEYAPKPAP
jgi:serine/threonine protein kinase